MIEYKVDRQVTAAELIEFLQRFPPETLVNTEGCDCVGKCNGVYAYQNQVTVSRR